MHPGSVQELVARGKFLALCGCGHCLPLQGAPSPWNPCVRGCPGQQHQGRLLGAPACMFRATRLVPSIGTHGQTAEWFPWAGAFGFCIYGPRTSSLSWFRSRKMEVMGFPHRTLTMLHAPYPGTLRCNRWQMSSLRFVFLQRWRLGSSHVWGTGTSLVGDI